MAENHDKAPRHVMSRYEWRWIGIALAGLAVFLTMSLGFTMTHRGRLPMTPKVDSVQTILNSEMFQHPGVTRIGAHHYRAVIIARQFAFDPPSLQVPVGSRVDFYITSADVVHGFELPDSVINTELFPGYVSHIHATFHKIQTFISVCNQFCGSGHQNMLGKFAVVSEADYQKSLKTGEASAKAPALPLAGVTALIGGPRLAAGKSAFDANCAGCHQATGQGVPGAFPPLAGTLGEYTGTVQGRLVLTHVLLDGLHGSIKAKGKSYNGVMPAWPQLSDKQIANIENYIVSAWGNDRSLPKSFKPFSTSETAKARTPKLSAGAVAAEYAKLPAQ